MSAAPERKAVTSLDERVREWVAARPEGGPPAAEALRARAAEVVLERGLPKGNEERWRFTPITELLRSSFLPLGRRPVPEEVPPAGEVRAVDGRAAIAGEMPEGLTVTGLAEAGDVTLGGAGLGELLGSAASLDHPFAALNGALFEDVVVVRVAPGADATLRVSWHGSGEGRAAHPRLLVLGGRGSRLRLVEWFTGAEDGYLTNPVAEVLLDEGAEVDHLRVAEDGLAGFHLGVVAARAVRDARYVSRVMSFGGRLTRVDLDVALAGEGAETRLDGLYLTGGDQVVDHHTSVDHQSPHATSAEVYKGILDGRSRGVFDGTIIVRPHAQKTSGSQENRNLLLSRDALVHTKPRLEIDADDVKASHGATVGQLDQAQLFYLRSRGLDEDAAKAVLVFGFARELIDRIPDEAARHAVGEALLARLPQGERLRELT